jgi:signal transduction histidine kinase
MRALISELGQDPLAGGFVPALARHVAKVAEQDGVDVRLVAPEDAIAIPPRTEAHLFGIGREALANSVKHSGASTTWVRVQALPGRVQLEIEDDGRGFDAEAAFAGHFGLESMRARAAEIGGRLTISTAPGKGTVVRVETPAGGELDG